MEFKTVGGHTFAPSLLSDGVIIDVGCRDFTFADSECFNGHHIHAIDPDPNVFNNFTNLPLTNMIIPHNLAISDKTGFTTYYPNGEATMIREVDPDPTYVHIDKKYSGNCMTVTMEDLYKITGENIDILKLDCEGAEYIILGETFKPIPKQISVEFHHHCVPELHKQKYTEIIERLSKHYTMHNNVWEQRHGCGFNFWDTLFIRKDLL